MDTNTLSMEFLYTMNVTKFPKLCHGCGLILEKSDYYFNNILNDYYSKCKTCHKKRCSENDSKRKAPIRTKRTTVLSTTIVCDRCNQEQPFDQYRKPVLLDPPHTTCKKCRAIIRAAQWHDEHAERYNANSRENYKRRTSDGWKRTRNETERKAANVRYRERHRERLRAESRARNAAGVYRDNRRRHVILRRARLANAVGTWTIDEWQSLLAKYGNQCLRCGTTKRLSFDHVIPITKGGENTIENAQPLCVPCNCFKAKRCFDYRLPNQALLQADPEFSDRLSAT